MEPERIFTILSLSLSLFFFFSKIRKFRIREIPISDASSSLLEENRTQTNRVPILFPNSLLATTSFSSSSRRRRFFFFFFFFVNFWDISGTKVRVLTLVENFWGVFFWLWGWGTTRRCWSTTAMAAEGSPAAEEARSRARFASRRSPIMAIDLGPSFNAVINFISVSERWSRIWEWNFGFARIRFCKIWFLSFLVLVWLIWLDFNMVVVVVVDIT